MYTQSRKLSALILALTLSATCHSQTFLTNGLIAHYPFNGNANDASGNGRNALAQGNYQYLTNGTLHLIGDNSLFYSGGGFVRLPDYGNLNSGFTISLWVANEADHGTSIMAEYYVWLDNNTSSAIFMYQHEFGVADHNAGVAFPVAIADYTPWKHLVLTYSPGTCAAYLNGTKIGSTTNFTASPFPMVNAAIGRHWWAGGANSSARMTMDIKNFRIYGRGLSSNEVGQLYSIESGPRIDLIKAVKPSFSYLTLSNVYQMQTSTDMNTWVNHGSPFTATNSSMVYPEFFEASTGSRLYFRVKTGP